MNFKDTDIQFIVEPFLYSNFIDYFSKNWDSYTKYTAFYSLYSAHKGVDFPGGLEGKASAYNVGGLGSVPRLGRSPREGNGNPLQYAFLENPMDGGSW